jgi:hypothetical protein
MYLLLLLVDDKEVRVPKQRIDIFSSTLEEIFPTRKTSFSTFSRSVSTLTLYLLTSEAMINKSHILSSKSD